YYSSLPELKAGYSSIDTNWIEIGSNSDLQKNTRQQLTGSLRGLIPWRKGPYKLFGIEIDSEWRSYMKWNRLAAVLPYLKNSSVLDIGCSSGYYMFRMLNEKPAFVLGIDPSCLYYFQFLTIKKYFNSSINHHSTPLGYLPVGFADLYPFDKYFDVVFFMGILYHQRSPVDTLKSIKKCIKPDGLLVFETIIIQGSNDVALYPKKRYAKMANVHFIPTLSCLKNWLNRSGFNKIEVLSVDKTTTCEQRKTDWSSQESLENFLDKKDPDKTVEGYPAPFRACIKARIK
ncbi:MAG: tRNA 5-methoxyuridine(34)/uridine 5-oxyacetic acid(34) synthase CmoB, partial [bacterium]|nr:tRNA 5-methoxyuridine(34)/uridine 5-oxyacetic acid(34) synthase CmoB [bacterium]